MPRFARAGSLILAALFCTACFNASFVVTVRPDGSGTIDETVMMTSQAIQQMAGLAAMTGGDPDKAGLNPSEMLKEEEVRKRAERFGTGVTFESSEPVKTADGEGYKARYSFKDVSKLSLRQVPDSPVPGMSGGQSEDGVMALAFSRGPSGSLLTLKMSQTAAEGQETGETKSVLPENVPPEAIMMMRQMFKGARMSLVLALDGRITRTNAPAALVDGSRITLADIDFERLLADPASLERLRELRSISDARKMAVGVPGLRMFTEPELVVQFSGR